MPIKNYRSEMDPRKSAANIEGALIEFGAREMRRFYDEDGSLAGLLFVLDVNGRKIPFRIPVDVAGMKKALEEDPGISRTISTKQARRTAWKNVHDWVLAQLALYEMNQVRPAEIFLPFVWDERTERTLSEVFMDSPEQLLLTE